MVTWRVYLKRAGLVLADREVTSHHLHPVANVGTHATPARQTENRQGHHEQCETKKIFPGRQIIDADASA